MILGDLSGVFYVGHYLIDACLCLQSIRKLNFGRNTERGSFKSLQTSHKGEMAAIQYGQRMEETCHSLMSACNQFRTTEIYLKTSLMYDNSISEHI